MKFGTNECFKIRNQDLIIILMYLPRELPAVLYLNLKLHKLFSKNFTARFRFDDDRVQFNFLRRTNLCEAKTT